MGAESAFDALADALKGIAQKGLGTPSKLPPSEEVVQNNYSDKLADARLKGINQDQIERKKYAFLIYLLIVLWLGALLFIICLQGFNAFQGFWTWNIKFSLSDNVLIALISGTTINILALFALVVRYLFNVSDTTE